MKLGLAGGLLGHRPYDAPRRRRVLRGGHVEGGRTRGPPPAGLSLDPAVAPLCGRLGSSLSVGPGGLDHDRGQRPVRLRPRCADIRREASPSPCSSVHRSASPHGRRSAPRGRRSRHAVGPDAWTAGTIWSSLSRLFDDDRQGLHQDLALGGHVGPPEQPLDGGIELEQAGRRTGRRRCRRWVRRHCPAGADQGRCRSGSSRCAPGGGPGRSGTGGRRCILAKAAHPAASSTVAPTTWTNDDVCDATVRRGLLEGHRPFGALGQDQLVLLQDVHGRLPEALEVRAIERVRSAGGGRGGAERDREAVA